MLTPLPLALAAGVSCYLCYKIFSLSVALRQTKDALLKEQSNRKSERSGRIRFEQELRRLQLDLAARSSDLPPEPSSAQEGQSSQEAAGPPKRMSSFPFKPIGYITSCFSQRNGTPRQPLLVPLARSRLQLAPDVHASSLEGLEQYTHCWVIYVFHENTDLVKVLQGDRTGKHSKISVPRLNGARMGVLATRSPHRPVPIGLSVAQVLEVKGNTVVLGGADIVDGSPVLDIKPYVPFCDGLPHARAPAWVKAEAEDEPLKVQEVQVPAEVQEALVRCWTKHQTKSLYRSEDEWIEFVKQVLSRDIRALHKRLGLAQQQSLYHVILEGVDISYDVVGQGVILVRGAELGGTGGRVMLQKDQTEPSSQEEES